MGTSTIEWTDLTWNPVTGCDRQITDPCQCTDNEIRRTIRNGLRAGASRPRTLPDTTTPGAHTAPLWTEGSAA